MAGIATLSMKLKVTGLGKDVEFGTSKALTVPVEHQEGYTVVETAQSVAIQLFDLIDHIALTKIYGIGIIAEAGTIYVMPDTAGALTFTSTEAVHTLNVGEPCWLPINPTGNLGLKIDAASITDSFSWVILGKVNLQQLLN